MPEPKERAEVVLDPVVRVFAEVGELAEDVRRAFEDLDRRHPEGCRCAGECSPDLDLFETPVQFEIQVDLPGVAADAVRVFIKAGTVVIVGDKRAPETAMAEAATFHRVERTFGRFVRGVRLPSAIDAEGARANLHAGELTVIVPKIDERRGREVVVPIEERPGRSGEAS